MAISRQGQGRTIGGNRVRQGCGPVLRGVATVPRARHDLDLAWKEALTSWLPQALEFFLPQAHAAVDWRSPPEFLENEVRRLGRGLKGQGRRVDLVARLRLRSGDSAILVLHLEVQSQRDDSIALRMRLYHNRLFDRYQCPILSLLILGDAYPDWRPSSHVTDFAGCRSGVWFPVVKLCDWRDRRVELEATRNPLALVVAAHLAVLETRPDQPARLHAAMRLCRLMARHGYSRDDRDGLFDILASMMAMTDHLYQEFELGVARLEEELDMPLESPFARWRFKKGRQEGRQEGLQEGQLEDRRASIGDIAGARFGVVPEGLAEVLQGLSDRAVLQRLTRLAATVATVEELLEAARREAQG